MKRRHWHKRVGLFGWTVTFMAHDEGDSYGFPGSRGFSIGLVGWRDKRR